MSTPKRRPRRLSLGIDVGKADFHCRLLGYREDYRTIDSYGKRKFDNTPGGHVALVRWLGARCAEGVPLAIAAEATGVYHERLAYALADAGYALSIQLPNKVQHFGRSLNEQSKTDDIDAYLIARMGLERELAPWSPPSATRRGLRVLTREHQAINEHLTAVKNQRDALQTAVGTPAATLARYEARIAALTEDLEAVEADIAAVVAAEEDLRNEVTLLTTIPGVGVKTAAVALAETDSFALFTKRSQLIKFCGYDIVYKSSGTSVKGRERISKRGNSRVRRALYFPVLSAIKPEGVFKRIYERTYERTRCKMMANVAVQRKLLITMMALIKSGAAYDPEHYRNHGRSTGEAPGEETGQPEGQPAVDADCLAVAP